VTFLENFQMVSQFPRNFSNEYHKKILYLLFQKF